MMRDKQDLTEIPSTSRWWFGLIYPERVEYRYGFTDMVSTKTVYQRLWTHKSTMQISQDPLMFERDIARFTILWTLACPLGGFKVQWIHHIDNVTSLVHWRAKSMMTEEKTKWFLKLNFSNLLQTFFTIGSSSQARLTTNAITMMWWKVHLPRFWRVIERGNMEYTPN